MRKTLIVLLTVFAVAIGVLTLARPTGASHAVTDVSAEESQNSSTVPATDATTTSTSTTVAPTTTTTAPPPPPTTIAPKPKQVPAPAAAKKPAVAAGTASAGGCNKSRNQPFRLCVFARESTCNYGSVGGGGYGIIDPTWRAQGFATKFGVAHSWLASPAQQDQAFNELYAMLGTRPWAPYDGC